MTDDELTTTDVLTDPTKNLCNLYQNNQDLDDHEADIIALHDNEYYTESEFIDFLETRNYTDKNHITVLSINIANLISKLQSLKNFLSHLAFKGNRPDVIVIVESHIPEDEAGHSKEELANIVPGYMFFHRGRRVKKGGGVGVLVSKDLKSEPSICHKSQDRIGYHEESFENIVVRIPKLISRSGCNSSKDLVVAAIYRQPNSQTVETFLECTERLMKTIDKSNSE